MIKILIKGGEMGFFTKFIENKVKNTIKYTYGKEITDAGIKLCDKLIKKLETKKDKEKDEKRDF